MTEGSQLPRRLGVFTAATIVIGIFRLRRTRPDLPRPYKTLGYALVPLIFVGAALLLLTNSMVQQPADTLISVVITLLGLPVYFIWRRFTAAAPAAAPSP